MKRLSALTSHGLREGLIEVLVCFTSFGILSDPKISYIEGIPQKCCKENEQTAATWCKITGEANNKHAKTWEGKLRRFFRKLGHSKVPVHNG